MADQSEWFTNPEHAHVVGLDDQLARELRSVFSLAELTVDCGVEGNGPYIYHFRISNVPPDMHGHVVSHAIDFLSEWTAYRFEVHIS